MPSTATDRIDGLTTSVAVKAPCKAVSTASLTLSGEQTVGSVACVTGDRVLYALTGGSVSNGIWVVSTGAWTRAKDFDGNRDVVEGTQVLVIGAGDAATVYRVTTADPITIGTTAIEFTEGGLADIANSTFTLDATGAVSRSSRAKLSEFVSPEDFGATGDGTADDAAELQAFFDHLAANGGVGILGRKTYKTTAQITLTTPARGFSVFGSGPESVIALRATSNVSVLGWVTPQDIVLSDFKLDCGYSVTGFASHGFSFRNADSVTVRNLIVSDYLNSAGLTFVDTDDTYGDCHIINCRAFGGGTAQNGFLHEGMLRSSIQNCTVEDLSTSGSPCVGLQLKNRCKHSWIDGGFASECKSGVALGGDGATFGDGPFNCWIRGVITKDCLDGATIGKSTDCTVEISADQTNSPAPGVLTGYALNVAGANVNLSCVVRIKGVQAGRTSILVRSEDVSIFVPYANGIGDKILEMSAGVDRCRLVVQDIEDSAVGNLNDYVTDNSGSTTNEVVFMRDLPGGGLAGANYIKLPVTGKTQNWMAFSGSTDTINWRINGTDRAALSATTHRPTPDNTLSSGTASFRWTEVFAVAGAINTSDEREKRDFSPITDDVLDAWADVDFASFRWRDAVDTKGDGARIHFGLVAQRVQAAFASRGLDPFRFGVLCYDEWQDQLEEELDANGRRTGKKMLKLAAGNRFGIRYDEALILEAALMRRELRKLKSKE